MEEKKKQFVAIVLSAGVGRRMGSNTPKQYMDLNGFPVIYYSLKAFQDSEVSSIILVTGKEDMEYCQKEIVDRYCLDKVVSIIHGGEQRYDSVYEGLKEIGSADYVLIHDGARPMLDQTIIKESMDAVERYGAVVVGVPVKDTVKISDDEGFSECTPNRDALWLVQTPQSFSYELICGAYEKVYSAMESKEQVPPITDDAMIVENFTKTKVKLIKGNYRNIKITTPEDLKIASVLLE